MAAAIASPEKSYLRNTGRGLFIHESVMTKQHANAHPIEASFLSGMCRRVAGSETLPATLLLGWVYDETASILSCRVSSFVLGI